MRCHFNTLKRERDLASWDKPASALSHHASPAKTAGGAGYRPLLFRLLTLKSHSASPSPLRLSLSASEKNGRWLKEGARVRGRRSASPHPRHLANCRLVSTLWMALIMGSDEGKSNDGKLRKNCTPRLIYGHVLKAHKIVVCEPGVEAMQGCSKNAVRVDEGRAGVVVREQIADNNKTDWWVNRPWDKSRYFGK